MRLIDIKREIEIASMNFNPIYSNSNGNYYIDNIQSLKIGLQSLYNADILERKPNTIDVFTIIDSSMTDRIIVDSSQIAVYRNEISKMENTIKILHSWISRYVQNEDDESTINIKLPTLCKIEDLTKASTIINKALSQSASEIGGEVKIKHLDYGSSWIIISLGTALAARLAVTLANAAFTIAQKYFGIKMMQQQYERYSMGTETLRTVKETNEIIIATEIRTLAENVEKEFYPESDNERIERIRVSISEMAKLIELGGEIHPSLIAASSNEIKSPDYKSLMGVLKSIGELPRSGYPDSKNNQEIPDSN